MLTSPGGGLCILTMVCVASAAPAQMPGSVKVTTSKLDGERQVQVTPGWLKGDRLLEATPKLGGLWSDKSPTNFTLEAALVGGGAPEKLKVGIDGRISEFLATSAAPGTSYNPSMKVVETSKRFEVPLAVVQQMVGARTSSFKSVMRVVSPKAFSLSTRRRERGLGLRKRLRRFRIPT